MKRLRSTEPKFKTLYLQKPSGTLSIASCVWCCLGTDARPPRPSSALLNPNHSLKRLVLPGHRRAG